MVSYRAKGGKMRICKIIGIFAILGFLIVTFGPIIKATPPPVRTVDVTLEAVDSESGEVLTSYWLNYSYHNITESYLIEEAPTTLKLPYHLDESRLSVNKEGYSPVNKSVVLDENKHITFDLPPLSNTSLVFHIMGGDEIPVRNASILIRTVSTNRNFSGITDENGIFPFPAQMVNYHITVSKDGYYTEERDIIVDHNLSQMDFNITLQKIPPQYTRAVYLTIKDKNDNPVEGAEVEVHSPEIDVANATNKNGSVMFHLPSDDYTLTISASGYETAEYPLWIDNEPTAFKDYFVITKSKFSLLDYWYLWIVLIAVIAAVIIALARRK